jgi:DNA-binding SARP family transcriptional activator
MPSSEPNLTLSFLGGFSAHWNGRSVAGFGYDKMRALLAYLAVEQDRDHSREFLAALLWETSSPAVGRGNLRRTLSDLRRVLELPTRSTLFAGTKHTVRFVSACEVDAVRFTRPPAGCAAASACHRCDACLSHLEAAAALYRGEFLAGLSLPDSPEFEDWLLVRRESLHRHALALLEHLSGHHEQQGQIERAIPFASRLIELDPWQEAGHRRLMRLLALNGQQSAALAQYENCRALLWKELGVQPHEETLDLFRRIGKGELHPAESRAAPAPAALPPPSARRQVTVLYCELSVADAEDPEDALHRLREPQARCGDILRAHGGHLVQSHGGGLLAYFGYPEAREDAARQAVRAALALAAAAVPSPVRCGIHTGLIVTAPGQALPDAAGQTSNHAIHLRLLARAGEVAVSQATHRLVTGYFRSRSLGLQWIGMSAQPTEVHLIDGATGAAHRLEAAPALTPFVGRAREFGQLRAHWRRACGGEAAVVLLRGDPGVGKSRLVLEMRKRLLPEQADRVHEFRCLPHHDGTPFYPVAHWLGRWCGFLKGDSDAEKRRRLDHVLQSHPVPREGEADLLARLLSLPVEEGAPVLRLARSEQRQRLMEAMADILSGLSRRRPVLMVFEDAHWADSSTLELIRMLAERAGTLPFLLLLTARPEFDFTPWEGTGGATIELARLPDEDARTLAGKLERNLTEAQTQRIVALSDGVPLFIEELARWSAAAEGEPGQAAVPATLDDLLMARVDQLGEALRTAQIAATIGREFGRNLLAAASEDGEPLERHLAALLRSGLVLRNDWPAGERFQFKHALIQEAAYQSQPRSLRRRTHGHIATVLQRDFADVCRSSPAVVAHHLTEAGETEPAIEYWHRAGQAAARYSGDQEAVRHYRQALRLLESLPPSAQRDRSEMPLQLALGTTLNAVQGYAAADTRRAFSRAQELAREVGGTDGQFRTLYGMWTSLTDHAQAREVTELLIGLAETGRHPGQLVMAHFADLTVRFWMSPFRESRMRAERVIALCREIDTRECIAVYGENPLSCTLSFLSRSLWFEGYADRAVRVSGEALAEARRHRFAHGLCWALAFACQLYRCLRRPERVEELGRELMALAGQQNLELWRHTGDGHIGWALAARGDPAGIEIALRGLAGIRRTLPMVEVSYAAILMDAYAQLGRHGDLLREIDAVLETASRRNDKYLLPELCRLKGESLLAVDPANGAQASALFRQALAQASGSGARALALRAAMSLARMERSRESVDALERILAKFGEGLATADCREARILADEWGGAALLRDD